MFHKRERVLAVIVFATLYCKVAAVTEKHLDMALDAVDNQYNGCRDQVLEKVVKSGLLTEELNRNGEFQKAWNANTQCSKLISGGVKEHTSALLTYTFGGSKFRNTFNDAVETMGGNATVYDSNFPYKSLHFLLMDSMKLLNNGTCKIVYRIASQKYAVQKGLKFRFGRFTLANSDYSSLREEPSLEKGMLFIINSCSVINLEENTCNQGEDIELLISPAEVFTVAEIKHVTVDYDHTEVVLKHEGFHSYHDCYLFPRPPNGSSTQTLGAILLVFMALSALLFIC